MNLMMFEVIGFHFKAFPFIICRDWTTYSICLFLMIQYLLIIEALQVIKHFCNEEFIYMLKIGPLSVCPCGVPSSNFINKELIPLYLIIKLLLFNSSINRRRFLPDISILYNLIIIPFLFTLSNALSRKFAANAWFICSMIFMCIIIIIRIFY
eukprot:472321_1